MSLKNLRKFIKEEIGRNFHTQDTSPITFDDFQDYNIEINGASDAGFFLNIFYKNEKIAPTQKFSSYNEAFHQSRMIIDNDRIKRMNVGS